MEMKALEEDLRHFEFLANNQLQLFHITEHFINKHVKIRLTHF